jgi:HEPN domain
LSKRDEHDVADALLAKAVGDEAGLRVLVDHPDVPDHVAGFLAQQAIEKSLKAVLTARGVLFERSHDIDYLCSLIEESDLPVTAELRDAVALTPWTIVGLPDTDLQYQCSTGWPWLAEAAMRSRHLRRFNRAMERADFAVREQR